jgi:DNA-binding LacI/PurR family transcriptional regulator
MAEATIKDVAKEAGVSEQTVLVYIERKANVKPTEANRIRRAMEKLNFTEPPSLRQVN